MRMPLHDDYKAEELITDVGGNAEGPEELLTVDEYLMPLRWAEDEKKSAEVLWSCYSSNEDTSLMLKRFLIFSVLLWHGITSLLFVAITTNTAAVNNRFTLLMLKVKSRYCRDS